MDFDIVLVTRNRKKALQLSVPLMLGQSRHPRKFVIVDASDNHQEVCKTLGELFDNARTSTELIVCHTQPGMTLQRNIGLKHVQSPVVFFPDDDALWFPGVADAVMSVYERDDTELLGAVCATEVFAPPPDVLDHKSSYEMELRDRVQKAIGYYINNIEKRLFPDPLFVEAFQKMRGREAPSWLSELDAALAELMTGFRMSFRTEIIQNIGFDEDLGKYALFEDRDASLGVLNTHLIARALKAMVFHYRAPEKRVEGAAWGALHVLNRAYVTCKHSPFSSPSRYLLRKYSYYKLFKYFLQGTSQYGRQRIIGAWRVLSHLPEIMKASPDELTMVYLRVRNECLQG